MDTTARRRQDATPDDAAGRRQRFVVGVDGSPGARLALAWALAAAARDDATLLVLSVFPVEAYWLDPYVLDPGRIEAIGRDTGTRTRAVVDEVLRQPDVAALPRVADVPVHVLAVPGPAGPVLVQHSAAADLLVVGSRGRGGVRSTVLGSVALQCAASAGCPVVVVHPVSGSPRGGPDAPRVVVGLDDSPHGRAALSAALGEAGRRGVRVQAVLAYDLPDYWSTMYAALTPSPEQRRAQALERARDLVEDVLAQEAGLADSGPVDVIVAEGAAGEALVRAAAGAELLVVGSRSRSRLPAVLLGSVALHSAVHAPCPVMIVRLVPEPVLPQAALEAPVAHG